MNGSDYAEIQEKDIEEVFEDYKSPVKNELPESPASLNIKFWAEGYGVMLTMRDEDVSRLMSKFKYMLTVIKKEGWKNKWDEAPVRVLPEAAPARQAPICGVHGQPMTWKTGISKSSGKPYAFWSCSIKNADGTYCKYSPPKEGFTQRVIPNPTNEEVISAF